MAISAAKLGRRSRKMREMISEATRTIEDSQTAQALHGLLSLKADSGPSNFPALLRAVGQHMSPPQPVSSPAHTYKLVESIEPANEEKTVSQRLAQAAAMAERHAETSPQLQQSQASKARAGSVLDLLLQMQSQANAASASLPSPVTSSTTTESHHIVSTSFPLSTISTLLSLTSNITSTTNTVSRKLQSSSSESARPTHITVPVSSPVVTKVPAAALTQLIQAQVPSGTPVQCKPSQLTPTNQTKVTSLPPGFRMLTAQSPSGTQTVYQGPGGEIYFPSQIQLPGAGSPIILQPSSMVISTSTNTTARSAPTRTSQDEPNKSPLKKRPYPFTTPTILATPQLSGKATKSDTTTSPSPVTLVVQHMDGTLPLQPAVSLPQIVSTVSLAKHNDHTAVVSPIVKGDQGETSPPQSLSPTHSHAQLSHLISEGYNDIFHNIRDQMHQLRDKHMSAGGDAMANVIDKVLQESMVPQNGQVSQP